MNKENLKALHELNHIDWFLKDDKLTRIYNGYQMTINFDTKTTDIFNPSFELILSMPFTPTDFFYFEHVKKKLSLEKEIFFFFQYFK